MNVGPRIPRLLGLFLFLLAAPTPLFPQGWIEPVRPLPGSRVERVESRVRVEVEGQVATVVVDEWFRAFGRPLAEADYLYPLPPGSAFSSFSLYQGEEELRGEVMDADRAREVYENIVRKRRDPALIELAGHGLLRARVFPLNPGETRRVTLRYTQLLERAGDALHFRYAGGTAPAPGCESGGSAPPTRCRKEAANVDLRVIVEAGSRFLEPFSPTHPIRGSREGGTLVVRSEGPMDGPFSLFLPLARGGVGLTLATHKPLGEDGYFILSLSPGQGDVRPEPRDLTVVLDVSGSMSGDKIRQARTALLDLLESLHGQDRVRLVAFSNGVRPFSLEWEEATRAVLDRARDWVEGLDANGGTNISGALAEAFRLESPPSRLPVTVFLTDGLPTVGETSVDAISAMVDRRRGRIRVFSLGVGHDVNTALLDRLAEEGRGSTSYLAPEESVERALSLLATKIRYPVLTELSLARSPVRITEVYPVEIPDVFAGEELVLFGRYGSEGEDRRGALTIQGQRGGDRERFTLTATFPEHENRNAFLPRLWASRKLGFLTRRVWTEGEDPELIREIRETALRYGLPSPYTSYLVLEPGMAVDQAVPSALPRPVAGAGLRTADPAPATSGEGAVRRARRAKALRDVASLSQLEKAEEEVRGDLAGGGGDSMMVAGRLFLLRDGVWRDAGIQEETELLTIQPFSRAYFDLLDRIPELRVFATTMDAFEVQGVELRVRIREGGEDTLSAKVLRTVRRAFLDGDGSDR